MIARVADSCFWLQRYVERFDYTARLISINLETLLDVELPLDEHWRPLLEAAGEEDSFVERHGAAARDDGEVVQAYLTWSEANPVSILTSAHNARENARTIRETLSLEAWETLNRFWLWLSGGPGKRLYKSDRESFYEMLRQEALLFRGVCLETMPHDRPFDFLRLGTTLERASQIARTLGVKYHQMAPIHREEAYEGSDQLTLWLALLRCSGCSEAFFKRGFPLEGRFVAEFMIFDRDHPRTILHNIERSWNFLQRIRPVRGARYPSARLDLRPAPGAAAGLDRRSAGARHRPLPRQPGGSARSGGRGHPARLLLRAGGDRAAGRGSFDPRGAAGQAARPAHQRQS